MFKCSNSQILKYSNTQIVSHPGVINPSPMQANGVLDSLFLPQGG